MLKEELVSREVCVALMGLLVVVVAAVVSA